MSHLNPLHVNIKCNHMNHMFFDVKLLVKPLISCFLKLEASSFFSVSVATLSFHFFCDYFCIFAGKVFRLFFVLFWILHNGIWTSINDLLQDAVTDDTATRYGDLKITFAWLHVFVTNFYCYCFEFVKLVFMLFFCPKNDKSCSQSILTI